MNAGYMWAAYTAIGVILTGYIGSIVWRLAVATRRNRVQLRHQTEEVGHETCIAG